MTSLNTPNQPLDYAKPPSRLKVIESFLDKDSFLERHFAWLTPVFFGLVTLCLFGDMLSGFWPGTVLSHYGHDITSLMFPMWSFAAKEMQAGHTPLWNPHIFSGSPFVGNFNSGLFYPLHWLIRWLPLALAMNWIIALDFFLAGYFAALWGRVRGLSTVGCMVVGMIFAFSGPVYLHLFPGHIPVLSCVAWVPVVFLAIDALRNEAKLKWGLVGGFAVGMQILTGFPQIVYYTALLAGLYTLCYLPTAKQPVRMAVFALLFYIIGPAMGAVQLLPGLQTAGESARAGGNAFEFAAMTALPPENLILTIAPGFFGDIDMVKSKAFVGSAYPWEHYMYLGVAAVTLAIYGVFRGARGHGRWVLVVLSLLALVLGLGVYIKPFFKFLFDFMPLYGSFRGTARFNMFIALFVALLAGMGWDALSRSKSWSLPISVLVAGVLVALFGGYLTFGAEPALWKWWLGFMSQTHYISQAPEYYQLRDTIRESAATAGVSLLGAAGLFVLLAVILGVRRYLPAMRYAVALFLVAELFTFALSVRPSGSTAMGYPPAWKGMIENIDPTFRVFTSLGLANQSMVEGFNDVYGYDPVLLRRYAQILALNQGVSATDVDQVNFAMGLSRMPQQSSLAIYRLMRCMFIFAINPANNQGVTIDVPGPMRQLTLVPNIQVISMSDEKRGRAEMFDELEASNFEPTRKVLLESQPEGWKSDDAIPAIGTPLDSGIAGTAELVKATSDSLEIKVDIPGPRILLITDGYSRYWKVRPPEAGPQSQYQLLPADYAFRGVPLLAGKHHIVIEYRPDGFVAAKSLSIGTGLGSAGLCLWLAAAGRKPKSATPKKGEQPAAAKTAG